MLMKCTFTTLEMHEIENRWDPLGQLFTDDNSVRDSLMRSARAADAGSDSECSSVSSRRSCGTQIKASP